MTTADKIRTLRDKFREGTEPYVLAEEILAAIEMAQASDFNVVVPQSESPKRKRK